MKKNMGTTDRTMRIAAAIIIAVLYYFNAISGTAAIVLLVIAGIFILTGFLSFCPLYSLFGINTGKNKPVSKGNQ
jgi:hypothetical protein